MTACAVWLARDFLHRCGRPVDIPPCRHPHDRCPPLPARTEPTSKEKP